MNKTALTVALLLAAFAAGCGGGDTATPSTPTTGTRAATSTDSRAALERNIRTTLRANDRLSGYVLAHNTIPAWAQQSTGGPALAALRASAAQRRARGVEVRTLADQLQIVSITIDPSYTRAKGIVRSRQRVRPYRNNRPLGRGINLDERVQVTLHRLGSSERFVVWRVVAVR